MIGTGFESHLVSAKKIDSFRRGQISLWRVKVGGERFPQLPCTGHLASCRFLMFIIIYQGVDMYDAYKIPELQ